jgi:type IV pilus assembly protein PilW
MRAGRRAQRGFSLVELMVGLLISLLVGLVVYGTTIFMDAQRRTMMTGNTAFENALAGLYTIQHEVKGAGLGSLQNGQVPCLTLNAYRGGATIADSAPVAPVAIQPGATAKESDTITVLGGSAIVGAVPLTLLTPMADAAATLTVQTNTLIANGHLVVDANPGGGAPCTLMHVTKVTDTGFGIDVEHAAAQSTWNPASPVTAFATAPAYPAGSLVLDIGALQWTRYRVLNGNLEALDVPTGAAAQVADNVVMLKAWYGVTNGTTAEIAQWVPATDSWAEPLNGTHINAIRAVRIAIVARAAQRERPAVAGTACDTTTAAPTSWPDGPAIDLSSDPDWKCYRYRTFGLVVPLKNLLFGVSSS